MIWFSKVKDLVYKLPATILSPYNLCVLYYSQISMDIFLKYIFNGEVACTTWSRKITVNVIFIQYMFLSMWTPHLYSKRDSTGYGAQIWRRSVPSCIAWHRARGDVTNWLGIRDELESQGINVRALLKWVIKVVKWGGGPHLNTGTFEHCKSYRIF